MSEDRATVFLVRNIDWDLQEVMAVTSTRERAEAVIVASRECPHEPDYHAGNPQAIEQCRATHELYAENHYEIEEWVVDSPSLYDHEHLAPAATEAPDGPG